MSVGEIQYKKYLYILNSNGSLFFGETVEIFKKTETPDPAGFIQVMTNLEITNFVQNFNVCVYCESPLKIDKLYVALPQKTYI